MTDVATPRPETCSDCGEPEDYPVLVGLTGMNSGPGWPTYACASCARDRYQRHVIACEECREGVNCIEAKALRELILAARRLRLRERVKPQSA